MSKTGLGKGLGALISAPLPKTAPPPPSSAKGGGSSDKQEDLLVEGIAQVSVEKIQANPDQPRKQFDHGALEELMASIKNHGIVAPLVVTPKQANGNHLLIAGERRLRASRMLGLKKVPVIIRDAKEQEQLELSIIENVQRASLNPIEEAVAYRRLMDEFNLTQQEVSKRMGKSRPTVGNALRMLALPEEVQKAVIEGKISAGHAKILAGLEAPQEQQAYLKRILEQKLSVRDLESSTRKARSPRKTPSQAYDPVQEAQEEMLRERFGTKVQIKKSGGKGQISIHFYSHEELQKILNDLT